MKFTKMHGLGNDFIVLNRADIENYYTNDSMIDIVNLAHRHRGIGFDQAIIVEDFKQSDTLFTIKFLNADGSHAGGCGNGTRAAAGYFHKYTNTTHFQINILLPNGAFDCVDVDILPNNIAKIKMPKPKFSAEQIPLSDLRLNPQSLKINDFNGFCVNVGNPHYVVMIDNQDDFIDFPLADFGYQVEHDSLFPERINFEIIFVENRHTLKMRVWERGAGITQACGTGACASVIAAIHQGFVDNHCKVLLDGGELDISYDMKSQDLLMQGAYAFVFEGQLL